MSLVDQYNQDVSGWTRDSTRKLRNEVLRLVLNIGPGYNNLSGATKKYYGEASRIAFTFPYYMVFVHKGAGRGYGGFKSGKYTTATGGKRNTNQSSMGKIGSGQRQPKPWFNPVIEAAFPQLSEIVASYHGQKIMLNIQRVLID
jgi:hypothetical protein